MMRTGWGIIISWLLFALFLGGGATVSGQTEAPISQYVVRNYSYNPACAGLSESLAIQFNGVQSMVGVSGAPFTSSLCIHSPIYDAQMALGGGVMMDQFGPVINYQIHLNYSHLVKLSDFMFLSLGLRGSVNNYKVNFSGISLEDKRDPLFDNNIEGVFKPNVGFGAHLFTVDYYMGFSIPSVLSSTAQSPSGGVFHENKRPLYLTGAYALGLTENLAMRPSMLVCYTPGEQTITDLTLHLFYGSVFNGGVGYRLQRDLVFLVGLDLGNSWQINFSCDYHLGDLSRGGKGRHELTLQYSHAFDWRRSSRYVLKAKKRKESLKSLRYF